MGRMDYLFEFCYYDLWRFCIYKTFLQQYKSLKEQISNLAVIIATMLAYITKELDNQRIEDSSLWVFIVFLLLDKLFFLRKHTHIN